MTAIVRFDMPTATGQLVGPVHVESVTRFDKGWLRLWGRGLGLKYLGHWDALYRYQCRACDHLFLFGEIRNIDYAHQCTNERFDNGTNTRG